MLWRELLNSKIYFAMDEFLQIGSDVIVLGDGEFDGTSWLNTITEFGWNCRTVFYIL